MSQCAQALQAGVHGRLTMWQTGIARSRSSNCGLFWARTWACGWADYCRLVGGFAAGGSRFDFVST
jgi:hypothetical protein